MPDIAKRERKSDMHHHRHADGFRRRLEVPERVGVHPMSLAGEICGQQAASPDNAAVIDRLGLLANIGCSQQRPRPPA